MVKLTRNGVNSDGVSGDAEILFCLTTQVSSPDTDRVGPRPSADVDGLQIAIRSIDLIERDLIASSIVELCRARAFMRRHCLSVLKRAPGFEIGGDPGCPNVWQPIRTFISSAAARR
jgi:hypothetical protein